MANERTIARLQARIKERVAHSIEFELNDPRASFITVTQVELARDLATVKVFYSVLGSEAERSKAAHMLESATGFVQRQLGRVLRTRRTPRILWRYDESIELMDRMDRAIDAALDRDREVRGELPAEKKPAEVDEVESEYQDFLSTQDDDETV